jgi:hypothetical protein
MENVPHNICNKLRRSSQAAFLEVSESIDMGSLSFEQKAYLYISE